MADGQSCQSHEKPPCFILHLHADAAQQRHHDKSPDKTARIVYKHLCAAAESRKNRNAHRTEQNVNDHACRAEFPCQHHARQRHRKRLHCNRHPGWHWYGNLRENRQHRRKHADADNLLRRNFRSLTFPVFLFFLC